MSGVEAFLGSWQEQSKEGFDEMATKLGKKLLPISLQFIIILSFSSL